MGSHRRLSPQQRHTNDPQVTSRRCDSFDVHDVPPYAGGRSGAASPWRPRAESRVHLRQGSGIRAVSAVFASNRPCISTQALQNRYLLFIVHRRKMGRSALPGTAASVIGDCTRIVTNLC
jgi:hypothetical protein